MRFTILSFPPILLAVLPFFLAYKGYGLFMTAIFFFLWAMIRQAIVTTNITSRSKDKRVILNTLPISHYVEKVRWCLDKSGVDYEEEKDIGIFGAIFLGRMVPTLNIPGKSISISNSSDILRYVYGTQCGIEPVKSAFLQPSQEALQWESKMDKMGHDLRTFVYYNTLIACKNPDEMALLLWGLNEAEIPPWQKSLLKMTKPILMRFLIKVLDINQESSQKGLAKAEEVLKEVDNVLNSGRKYILGGDDPSYIDITFASLAGILAIPDQYGGPRLTPESRLKVNAISNEYQKAVLKFRKTPAGKHVLKMYSEHR